VDKEWWLWSGPYWDIAEGGKLHCVGRHFELYAVHLENGLPVACAGPLDSGMGTGPGPGHIRSLWPTGRQGHVMRKGRKGYSAGECPFLTAPCVLSTMIARLPEFTRFPYAQIFHYSSMATLMLLATKIVLTTSESSFTVHPEKGNVDGR
jgi:hypothetical protein